VENVKLAISASIQFHSKEQKRPIRHQLLLEFDDETAMSASCQLWGSFLCFQKDEISKNMDYVIAIQKLSPLSNEFEEIYFKSLFNNETPKKSVKEFLGTEQRIPGLGNGVLQDILWNAGIHPKRKMAELSEGQINGLYHAVKNILKKMEAEGGRDTEHDLFNQPGGYKTKMSKKTVGTSCPTCGTRILKESYLGGSVYICNGCQH
jgi:formamidopyrimidine-DNA glycosylase